MRTSCDLKTMSYLGACIQVRIPAQVFKKSLLERWFIVERGWGELVFQETINLSFTASIRSKSKYTTWIIADFQGAWWGKEFSLVQIPNISDWTKRGQDEQKAFIHSAWNSLTVCKASHVGLVFYGTEFHECQGQKF